MRRRINIPCGPILALALLAPLSAAFGSISTVDLVRVKDGHLDETLFYYKNNWKPYREAALERGYIKGFRLLIDRRTPGDETLLLITEYVDQEQYAQRESNFRQIMRDEPLLLNDTPPGEFREVSDLGVFEAE